MSKIKRKKIVSLLLRGFRYHHFIDELSSLSGEGENFEDTSPKEVRFSFKLNDYGTVEVLVERTPQEPEVYLGYGYETAPVAFKTSLVFLDYKKVITAVGYDIRKEWRREGNSNDFWRGIPEVVREITESEAAALEAALVLRKLLKAGDWEKLGLEGHKEAEGIKNG